jgi:hypothetical protein
MRWVGVCHSARKSTNNWDFMADRVMSLSVNGAISVARLAILPVASLFPTNVKFIHELCSLLPHICIILVIIISVINDFGDFLNNPLSLGSNYV